MIKRNRIRKKPLENKNNNKAIGLIMIAEVLLPGSLIYSAFVVVIALLFVNVLDTRYLLRIADDIDKKEPKEKT